MTRLADVVVKVRSKNAGPFWVTVDVFCGTEAAYAQVVAGLRSDAVAGRMGVPVQTLKRFEMPDLRVVKFSAPRPSVQGAVEDRDMHGASFALLLSDLEV